MKTINITDDYQLSRVQDNAKQAFDAIQADFPIVGGTQVIATIGTGDTLVNHKLQRPLQGWVVIRKGAQADLWESTTVNPRPNDQVILKASSSVAVTIYFF